MTLDEMMTETLAFWMANFRRQAMKLGKERMREEAMACAKLTRREMDSLIAIGLDEETAWTEARNLFCYARPPKLAS